MYSHAQEQGPSTQKTSGTCPQVMARPNNQASTFPTLPGYLSTDEIGPGPTGTVRSQPNHYSLVDETPSAPYLAPSPTVHRPPPYTPQDTGGQPAYMTVVVDMYAKTLQQRSANRSNEDTDYATIVDNTMYIT